MTSDFKVNYGAVQHKYHGSNNTSRQCSQHGDDHFHFVKKTVMIMIIIFLSFAWIFMWSGTSLNVSFRNSFSPVIFSTIVTDSADYDSLLFIASNEYGPISILPYSWLSLEDALLIEPFKLTSLELSNALDGCIYNWKIYDDFHVYSSVAQSENKSSVLFQVNRTGVITLEVQEFCYGDKTASRSISPKVYVKYIRRELRSLNDRDREAFLDALYTLYQVSSKYAIEDRPNLTSV